MSEHIKVKFYGIHDMSAGYYLREAEFVFQNWEEYINSSDINKIIELYNIKQYMDADIKLTYWSPEQFIEYKEKCKDIFKIIGKYCSGISDNNFESLYKSVDSDYKDDFWKIVCKFKVYKCIMSETMSHLLNNDEHTVWKVLHHAVLAKEFGSLIAEHLSNNKSTAEHLILHFLAAKERNNGTLYFPNEFDQDMRNKVLIEYIDRDNANINYLQLLERSQSSNEFPLSDKLRLKARKKKEIIQEKLFEHSVGITYGADVIFVSIPDGSIKTSYEKNVITCKYSKEWIDENRDYSTLLNNFIYLFQYVDNCFRCNFVSLSNDLGVIERHFGLKGKKDYIFGTAFNNERSLSLMQMAAYTRELQKFDIRLEDVFRWFFEEYLVDEFGAEGFFYFPPSIGTTLSEKCKLLSIAIDGVLKQYRIYCEDGLVDRELLEISSEHIIFGDLKGMIENKYAYADSDNLRMEMFLLFSDQSMMSYTEKTGSKYETLPQLLIAEKMKRDDFKEYQYKDLDWLIARSAVIVSEDDTLSINKNRVYVLKDLFENEVICPKYYNQGFIECVESLIKARDLRYEDTLFSKTEQDYLNYILNKSEFSNGLDLRNRYAHDTCSLKEKEQGQDYLELQKIMVLIIIKINEEFCLENPQKDSD